MTDRENIQFHWIRIEDVPAIWQRLDDAGLDSIEACGDSPRPFLGSPVAGVAKDEIIDGSDGAGRDQAARDRQPGVLQPAAQVQDRPDRPPQPRRLPRDQRHRLRRHRAPRPRPGLRRLGRRRTVDQPDAGPEAGRLGADRGRARRLGGRHLDLPRLRLPPAALARPAEVPGRRLGRREVPRGAREGVPRPRAGHLRLAALPHRPPRPRRRARAEGRQLLRRHRARSRAGSPAPSWSSSPTSWSSTASRAPASRRTRRSC